MGTPFDLQASSVPGALSVEDHSRSVELVARARAGELEALRTLLTRHQQRLLRIVRVRLGAGMRRWVDSEDVLQETYCAALASLAELDIVDSEDLLAWLARVATNRIRDLHDAAHAQRRDVGRCVPLETDAGPASQDSPSESAWRRELAEIVDRALLELQPEHREAILLRDYCGASWSAVAAAIDSPTVHAAQQLHQRAWIRLRRVVEPRLRGLGTGG